MATDVLMRLKPSLWGRHLLTDAVEAARRAEDTTRIAKADMVHLRPRFSCRRHHLADAVGVARPAADGMATDVPMRLKPSLWGRQLLADAVEAARRAEDITRIANASPPPSLSPEMDTGVHPLGTQPARDPRAVLYSLSRPRVGPARAVVGGYQVERPRRVPEAPALVGVVRAAFDPTRRRAWSLPHAPTPSALARDSVPLRNFRSPMTVGRI
jgi:hypothetical protein